MVGFSFFIELSTVEKYNPVKLVVHVIIHASLEIKG